jgi:hypothetical protein
MHQKHNMIVIIKMGEPVPKNEAVQESSHDESNDESYEKELIEEQDRILTEINELFIKESEYQYNGRKKCFRDKAIYYTKIADRLDELEKELSIVSTALGWGK